MSKLGANLCFKIQLFTSCCNFMNTSALISRKFAVTNTQLWACHSMPKSRYIAVVSNVHKKEWVFPRAATSWNIRGENYCSSLLYLTTKKIIGAFTIFFKISGGQLPGFSLVVGQVLPTQTKYVLPSQG